MQLAVAFLVSACSHTPSAPPPDTRSTPGTVISPPPRSVPVEVPRLEAPQTQAEPALPVLVTNHACTQLPADNGQRLAELASALRGQSGMVFVTAWVEHMGSNELTVAVARKCGDFVKEMLAKQGAPRHRMRVRTLGGGARSSACPTRRCNPEHRYVFVGKTQPSAQQLESLANQ